MATYSPFSKRLEDLEVADLVALRGAAEGWYIEYKREVLNASSIAKSVSAFANTYGGWLFYGVQEKSKEEAVAGAFPGVARSDVDAALQRMRQAVANQVTPSPHFDPKIFWGPCDEIGLAPDRAIICARVPWSAAAPHIHKDGRIYRRVADGSEPKPENDRSLLDQLFRRADKVRDQYEHWVENDPEFTKGEAKRPYLRLLIAADLWRDRGVWCDLGLEELRAIMRSSDGPGATVPFEIVYTSVDGFIARQIADNRPFDLGLTWRLRPDLRSEVLIPLNVHHAQRPGLWAYELDGFDHADRFGDMLRKQGHGDGRVVDLNLLFNILLGVVNIQERLSVRAGWTGSLYVKARLLNVWRTCPFIDIDAVLDQFEAHGVPMCLDGVVTAFPGSGPETFFEVEPYDTVQGGAETRIMLKALSIFRPIARALGTPEWLDMDRDQDGGARFFHTELLHAGIRGVEAQRRRAARASEGSG